MKRITLWAVGLLVFEMGCGPGRPENAEFKGTWKHSTENGLTGAKTEEIVVVTAKGNQFRETVQVSEQETTQVYNGETLFTKTTYDEESRESSQFVKEHEVSSRRFWANAVPQGSGKPGGTIGGRDTVFYLGGERRPDGELSLQLWVDSKTGVLLKSILTIYSSQVSSMVTQETWECQTIDYSPVPDSAFLKPS